MPAGAVASNLSRTRLHMDPAEILQLLVRPPGKIDASACQRPWPLPGYWAGLYKYKKRV